MYDTEISQVILAWGRIPERKGIVAGASSLLMFLVARPQAAQETGLRSMRKFLLGQYKQLLKPDYPSALTYSLLIGEFNKVFPQF